MAKMIITILYILKANLRHKTYVLHVFQVYNQFCKLNEAAQYHIRLYTVQQIPKLDCPLYSSLLYCVVHCVVHYCTLLCTVQYNIVLHFILYRTILYCIEHFTVLNCTLYCTVLYNLLYCAVHFTVLCCTLYCTVLYNYTALTCILAPPMSSAPTVLGLRTILSRPPGP